MTRNFGGKLASVSPSAGVNTILYSPDNNPRRLGFYATLSVTNRNDYDVLIRVALIDSEDNDLSDLADDDWIEYDLTLRANGVLERDGIAVNNKNSIVVYSDSDYVNFGLWG